MAVTVSDPDSPRRYFRFRGRMVDVTADGVADYIEELSQRYFGTPYRWYGGRDQVRFVIAIKAEKLSGKG